MNHAQNQDQDPHGQALIGDDWQPENNYQRESILSAIMGVTVYPVGRATRSFFSFIIPNFIKNGACRFYSYFSPPYSSAAFVNNLQDAGILRSELQDNEETKVHFQQDNFNDAVAEGFRLKKPILFILGDLMVDEIRDIMKEIFQDQEALKFLSQNYLVYGLEIGTEEANLLSQEFDIKEIPYFATIMSKSENEYDIVESYNEQEVEIEKFKQFLRESHGTFRSLLDYVLEQHRSNAPRRNRQNTTDSDVDIGGGFDYKIEEDRMLKEQQRIGEYFR